MASIAVSLFRGEQIECSVACVFRTAASGMESLSSPDCTAFSLGLFRYGLFETAVENIDLFR